MTTVILTIHVLIVLALIGVVLLQRSDGSALGIGGGSSGGFMTGAGAADALTRTTSILAALFFATSIGLAVFAGGGETADDIIEELTGEAPIDPTAPPSAEDLLKRLGGGTEDASSGAVAAPAEADVTSIDGAPDGGDSTGAVETAPEESAATEAAPADAEQ
ncbi:MAG: preprotein translocase subunit SecG [Pseudomonadota bacterium]